MAAGNVKWFNNAKGYGFILPEGGGEDLFAHYSSIQMDGYKTLKAGQDVEFDIVEGPKGLHAVNIRAPSADIRTPSAVSTDPVETEIEPTSEISDEAESSEEMPTPEVTLPPEDVAAEPASVAEKDPTSEPAPVSSSEATS